MILPYFAHAKVLELGGAIKDIKRRMPQNFASADATQRFAMETLRGHREQTLIKIQRYLYRAADLLTFFADRLKIFLRDRGARHDLLDAVFALGEDDLVLIVARINALDSS